MDLCAIIQPLARARQRPSLDNLVACAKPLIDAIGSAREFPFPLAYLPSGVFSNANLERYLRRNIERRGMANDFRTLHRTRQVELYIVAMNLDTAERVVFGHDEDCSVTISEAVQASTALPGFYKPARIRGVDYVDGGVRRTANIDVAEVHGEFAGELTARSKLVVHATGRVTGTIRYGLLERSCFSSPGII